MSKGELLAVRGGYETRISYEVYRSLGGVTDDLRKAVAHHAQLLIDTNQLREMVGNAPLPMEKKGGYRTVHEIDGMRYGVKTEINRRLTLILKL